MTAPSSTTNVRTGARTEPTSYPQVSTERTTETKPAFKTTELAVFALAVLGVLIATQVVDGLTATQGWLYVTMLTIGYMLSRGLAKAGSYAKDHDTNR